MRGAWLAGLACLALGASSARGDEWSRQYSLEGKPDLHLKAGDGNVRIEAGDGSEVAVRVTTEGWRIAPGEVSIVESQVGDRVDIEVKLPGGIGWRTGRRSIQVVVRVPRDADLDVRTGDGNIEVQPVSGRVSLSTGDGDIAADGLQGETRLHTGDGGIRANGLSGRLEADTGDGDLSVRGRFDHLDLHTGDGDVDAAVEPGSRIETAWSIRTGDGDVTLRLPGDLGADLDVQTGDGGIVLDKPALVTGTVRENALRGKVGPGGPPLKVRTGDGSIRLLGL